MANKEKSITRQKLFSILSNIVDTSDVFCKSSTSSTDVVEPNSILLIDSNDNEYINNTNNNINVNNLNDDDELQLVTKFSNIDIDDAHTWVEKLIIQLKLENNCEIIDEGDFDESSIIAIFIMDDFTNDINANLVINSEEDFDTMLAENTKKIQYSDKNVDDLISQIETLNQDNNISADENINTENNNDIKDDNDINITENDVNIDENINTENNIDIKDNNNTEDNNDIKDDINTENNINIKDDSNDIKDNVNYNENIIVGEQSEVINKQDINEDEINKNDINKNVSTAENINSNIENINGNIESINIVDETNNDSNISINNDVNANDDNSVICSDDINDSNNNINQDTNQDINDENISAEEINVNITDNVTNNTINNIADNTNDITVNITDNTINNVTDGTDNTINDINKTKKYKALSAEDILNNIDPLTGQIRYSSFINTQSNDNQSNDNQSSNDQFSNSQDTNDLTEENNNENNISTEESNNENNNIEENNNENDNNVQVINVTETTKNLKKTINSTSVTTKKTKANVKTNVNQVNSMPPSQGISLRGISNRVSATASDGRIISAAAQVREMLDEIIAKNNMTTNILVLLQDVANCKKEMKLTYPLLMKVNPNLDFKEQASFGGKKRYNKTIIQYCNQDFYVTNHIFAHNVSKIRSYLESLNLIDKKENTSTEPEIADKQKIIQDLINQKVNAPGKITNKQVTDSIKTETLKVDNIKIDNIKIDNIKINDTKTDIKI